MQEGGIKSGANVLIIDDLIATGQSPTLPLSLSVPSTTRYAGQSKKKKKKS